MLVQCLTQPAPPDLADQGIGDNLKVSIGPHIADEPEETVPGVIEIGIVQQHESARAELIRLGSQVSLNGEAEWGKPPWRPDFLDEHVGTPSKSSHVVDDAGKEFRSRTAWKLWRHGLSLGGAPSAAAVPRRGVTS